MSQQILTISQINEYIRAKLDSDVLLSGVAVRGEISNYKVYPSGHHYFTLKDDNSALKCVMFRGNSMRLKFRPENGMKVIAVGKISVYPRDGAYQLYCSTLTTDGVGDLHTAFEQLKAKLNKEGLFSPEFKKPLPPIPEKVCIITSEAGAAVHDMLRIIAARFPLTKVLLLPVRVQGSEAPGEIVSAIQYANQHKLADVLIVGRGGGSIEDLWAFNDEQVARAIFASQIPVISAVGHEPDVTISDYVADIRAATPSNAAELVVPDQNNLRQSIDKSYQLMISVLSRKLQSERRQLNILKSSSALQGPTQYIHRQRQQLHLLTAKLTSASQQIISKKKQEFIARTAKLDAMSPLKVISRGYAVVESDDGTLISSIKQTAAGSNIQIFLADGTIRSTVTETSEGSL